MKRKIFVIKSESKLLKPFRGKLKKFLKKAGRSSKTIRDFLLAGGEAATNSIRHAYLGKQNCKIQITVEAGKGKTILKVRDYGHKINLSKVKTPILPPKKPHGLGIYLLKTIMDEVKYNTRNRLGNEVILTQYHRKREKAHEDSSQKRRRRH